jgi:hypothetical protein
MTPDIEGNIVEEARTASDLSGIIAQELILTRRAGSFREKQKARAG